MNQKKIAQIFANNLIFVKKINVINYLWSHNNTRISPNHIKYSDIIIMMIIIMIMIIIIHIFNQISG